MTSFPDTAFDPWSEAYHADPVPAFAAMRRTRPVFQLNRSKYFVFRHMDVVEVLTDSAHFGAAALNEWHGARGGRSATDEVTRAVLAFAEAILLFHDAPRHGHTRAPLARATLAQITAARRPAMRALIDDALSPLLSEERDLVADVAEVIPARVIAQLVGVDDGSPSALVEMSKRTSRLAEPFIGRREVAEVAAGVAAFEALLRPLVRARRASPGTDILSLLTSMGGDDPMSDDAIVFNATFLFAAGVETTAASLAHLLWLLAQEPSLLAAVKADPTRAAALADEAIRLASPVQFVGRRVLRDHARFGFELHAGDALYCGLGSANRDEAVFVDADEPRLDRRRGHSLGFGFGAHHCIGASLARLEIEEVIAWLAARDVAVELRSAPRFRPTFFLRSLSSLRARLRSPSGAPP